MTAKLTRVYACKELDITLGVSDEKWAQLREDVESGRVKIQDCELVEPKAEENT